MAITAGNIEARMTLDVSQFNQGIAQAQTSLDTIAQGGERVNSAFSQVEARLGQSASQIAAGMEAAGQSTANLMQAVGRADAAAARVGELGAKAQAAAEGLSSAQAAAQASADALALLQQSAQASAENLAQARAELDQLQASGASTAEAAAQVQEFEQEVQTLDQELAAATATHEANTAAVERAQISYQKLSAQLLQAEASASQADAGLAAMTDTLSAAGSATQMMSTVSQMGTSTLTSAARSLGTMAAGMAGFQTGTVSGTLAARGFSTVLRTLVRSASGAQLGLLGLGAAAVAAGVKLYQAYQDAHDGTALWEHAMESVDDNRVQSMTTTIDAKLELNTGYLTGEVQSLYKKIETALTDGKPDTAAVISEIEENITTTFSSVRTQIQTWYDNEMAKLDLSTPEGVARAAELTDTYNGLLGTVQHLNDETNQWVSTYAGKATADCKAALGEIENIEGRLERIAQKIEELNALQQSGARGSYEMATQGVTSNDQIVSEAVVYAQYSYKSNLDLVQEQGTQEIQTLRDEWKEKIEGAKSDAEREEINIEYAAKIEAKQTEIDASKTKLTRDYQQMLGGVLQGVAEAIGREHPEIGAALQNAITQGADALDDVDLSTTSLPTVMKALVESGALEGITNADLSTAEGQLETMLQLLGQGTGESAERAFGKQILRDTESFLGDFASILGMAPLLDGSTADGIQLYADRVSAAMQTLAQCDDPTALAFALAQFRRAVDWEKGDTGGIENMASAITSFGEAAAAGNLDAEQLVKYGGQVQNLLGILDAMDAAGGKENVEFLTQLANAMNELGYTTDAEHVVEDLHALTDAYLGLGEAEQQGTEMPVTVDAPIEPTPQVGAVPDVSGEVTGKVEQASEPEQPVAVDVPLDPEPEFGPSDFEGTVQRQVDDAFSGLTLAKHTILGPVEVEDPSAEIGAIAGRVQAASDELGSAYSADQLESAHEAFRNALDFSDADGSGVERMAAALTAFGSAAASGQLSAEQLAQYAPTVQSLMTILSSMDAAGGAQNVAFLGQVAEALTNLGYPTDAEHAVETLRELAGAYAELGETAGEPIEVEQPVTVTPVPETNPDYMPSPEKLEGIYGPLPTANVEQPADMRLVPQSVTPPDAAQLGGAFTTLSTTPAQMNVPIAATLMPQSVTPPPAWVLGAAITAPIPMTIPIAATLMPESVSMAEGVDLSGSMAESGAAAGAAYAEAIAAASGSASAAAQGMASDAGSGADSAASAFSSAGSNAGSAFAAGIRSQISSAVAAAASMAAQAAAAARAKLSIHSPSKVFREMGANTTRGFALGISDEITRATSAVNRLATETMRAAAPVTNNDHRSVTINLNGASIAPGTDVRKFSRQLAQYIQGANFGVT